MKSKPSDIRRQIRCYAAGLLSAWMIFILSGAPALVIQVYAWVRMAQEAGGVEKVGEAMFAAPPCEICRIAHHISQDNSNDGETPAPVKRVAYLKLVLTLSREFSLPSSHAVDLHPIFARHFASDLPESISIGPPTLPPGCLKNLRRRRTLPVIEAVWR